ncbi:hypothetical protein C0J52_11879 [Blattella germanica]|nr:hypothetical protein C0J52_11879 [Blattella germanica]
MTLKSSFWRYLTTFICLSKQNSQPWSIGYWRSGSVLLNRCVSPSDAAIRRWSSQWSLKENVENKYPTGRPQTPENTEQVREEPEEVSKEACHSIVNVGQKCAAHFTQRLKSSTRIKMQLATAYYGWR